MESEQAKIEFISLELRPEEFVVYFIFKAWKKIGNDLFRLPHDPFTIALGTTKEFYNDFLSHPNLSIPYATRKAHERLLKDQKFILFNPTI